jgi:hypothetical protein
VIIIEIHGLLAPQALDKQAQIRVIFASSEFAPDVFTEIFLTGVRDIDGNCCPYLRIVAASKHLEAACRMLDPLKMRIQPVPSVFYEEPPVVPILPKPEVHTPIYQEDAPACDVCGSITFRNGNCYKCYNCGSSLGCS